MVWYRSTNPERLVKYCVDKIEIGHKHGFGAGLWNVSNKDEEKHGVSSYNFTKSSLTRMLICVIFVLGLTHIC